MATLFESIAGKSRDHFKIGEVRFMAAPFTIMEWQAYMAIPDDRDAFGEQMDFLADKLRRRIVDTTKVDPTGITAEWLMENLELPKKKILEYVLVYGELPKPSEDGDTPNVP